VLALSIAESDAPTPVPYLADGRVIGPDAPPRPVWFARSGVCRWPGAAISRDGRYVAYEAVLRRTRRGAPAEPAALPEVGDIVVPVLRVLDRVSGVDGVIAQGACDPFWSGDGRLAYVHATALEGVAGEPYPGWLVTMSGTLSSEQIGPPGEYRLAGWAGRALFVQRAETANSIARSELRLLDADGGVRLAWPSASLVAVRPDGKLALISTIPQSGTNTSERATLRLVDLGDGAVLSSLRLDPELENVAEDGWWTGNEVLVTVGYYPGGATHPMPGLVSVNVAGNRVAITAEYRFASRLIGPGPFANVTDPRAVDDHQVGAAFSWSGARHLSCDIDALTCLLGPMLGENAVLLR
jgi:hypothetical protein